MDETFLNQYGYEAMGPGKKKKGAAPVARRKKSGGGGGGGLDGLSGLFGAIVLVTLIAMNIQLVLQLLRYALIALVLFAVVKVVLAVRGAEPTQPSGNLIQSVPMEPEPAVVRTATEALPEERRMVVLPLEPENLDGETEPDGGRSWSEAELVEALNGPTLGFNKTEARAAARQAEGDTLEEAIVSVIKRS